MEVNEKFSVSMMEEIIDINAHCTQRADPGRPKRLKIYNKEPTFVLNLFPVIRKSHSSLPLVR